MAVIKFPTTDLPASVAEAALDLCKENEVEAVGFVIKTKDGEFLTSYSGMLASELLLFGEILKDEAMKLVIGGES